MTEFIWGVLLTLIGGLVYLRFQRPFTPALRLTISHRWLDHEMVVLRLEVENASSTNIETSKKVLQILEHKEGEELNEFVRLRKDDPRGSNPLEWRPPDDAHFLETTEGILPGERILVERSVRCPEGRMLHVLMQIQRVVTPFEIFLRERLPSWLYWPRQADSWTATIIVAREKLTSAAKSD